MAKSIPAIVTPKLLKWAREETGFLLEDVAEKLKRPFEEIRSWETNKETPPTLRQAEKLAKLYRTSYSVFTLPEPPRTIPLATEYRRLPNVIPGEESPDLRFALRELLFRRRVALELMEEMGNISERFSLTARLSENSEEMSKRIRKLLGISIELQHKWENDSQAWKAWRDAIEALDVLVFVFSDVDQEEVRGVSLFHSTLPVIGVNSKEIPSSRPFTLLHEFIHILFANGEEEKAAQDEKRTEAEWKKLEEFTEKIAGGILMPLEYILTEEMVKTRSASAIWSIEEIQRLARRYKVTPKAFATRLLSIGKMNPASYHQWNDDWRKYIENHPFKGGGIATPAEKALNKNGTAYTTLVIDALNMERITPVEASRYLNLHYPHVEELRLHFSFGRPLPTYRKTKGEG